MRDVGGRVTDGACSSLAAEWPDPERAVAIRSQSDGCACVHTKLGGSAWPLRMAKRMREWATSGVERRNTAAYGHAISLGAFRTALEVGVDEAGSVSWRSCTRRLVDLAARRLGGLSGRQLTGPVAEAPEVDLRSSAASRPTKPSWGSDVQEGLMRIPAFLSHKFPYKKSKKRSLSGGVHLFDVLINDCRVRVGKPMPFEARRLAAADPRHVHFFQPRKQADYR